MADSSPRATLYLDEGWTYGATAVVGAVRENAKMATNVDLRRLVPYSRWRSIKGTVIFLAKEEFD